MKFKLSRETTARITVGLWCQGCFSKSMSTFLQDQSPKTALWSWIYFSLVVALGVAFSPACAGQHVSLAWNGSSDSSVTRYALYYGTNSGNYTVRIDAGTNTVATVAQLSINITYYFAVSAFNSVGMESVPSEEVSVAVAADSPPELAPIVDQSVNAQQNLFITNTAAISGGGSTNLFYTLVAGPAGMEMNATKGVLSWNPSLTQAGSINVVTVQVSDDSIPPLTSLQTFTLTVGEAVQLNIAAAVVSVGQSGSVALTAWSSGLVTNLSFTLDAPAGWVGNLTVQSWLPPTAIVTQTPPGAVHSLITIQTVDGQALQGLQTLLQINFSTLPDQISTFAALQTSAVTAWLANGQMVPTTPNASSPLIMVGLDSLLQLQVINGEADLNLYGPVGNSYQLQSTVNLAAAGGWTNEFSVTLTSLSQTLRSLPTSGASMKFYRAVRL